MQKIRVERVSIFCWMGSCFHISYLRVPAKRCAKWHTLRAPALALRLSLCSVGFGPTSRYLEWKMVVPWASERANVSAFRRVLTATRKGVFDFWKVDFVEDVWGWGGCQWRCGQRNVERTVGQEAYLVMSCSIYTARRFLCKFISGTCGNNVRSIEACSLSYILWIMQLLSFKKFLTALT